MFVLNSHIFPFDVSTFIDTIYASSVCVCVSVHNTEYIPAILSKRIRGDTKQQMTHDAFAKVVMLDSEFKYKAIKLQSSTWISVCFKLKSH